MKPHPSLSAPYEPGTAPRGGLRTEIAQWAQSHAIATADEVLSRLRELGVRVPPSCRILRARDQIARADRFNVQFGPGDPDTERLVTEAQRCVFQAIIIARSFVDPSPEEIELLGTMLGGPDVPRPGRADPARAAQAELLTSALFRAAGYTTTTAEPDLVIDGRGEKLGVPVKRVTSDRQFRKRVVEAREQLMRSNLKGFIVVHADSYLTRVYFQDRGADLSATLYRKVVGWLDYIDIRDPENRVQAVVGMAMSFRLGRGPEGQIFEGLVHFHPRFVAESSDAALRAIDDLASAIANSMATSLSSLVA